MFLLICMFFWAVSLLGIFLFGFLFGRCARKLPIVDDTLPWTLHWGEIAEPRECDTAAHGQAQPRRSWPGSPDQAGADIRNQATALPCGREDCPVLK
jgi:hypothetical protein